MKLRTQLIAICDYAILSKENKLSINGIFDELRVTQLPGGVARAFLVATLVGEPEKTYKLTIKLESSNGKQVLNTTNLQAVISPNGKTNVLLELVGFGFEKEGDYRFVIYHGDDEVGSIGLKVIHVKQQQQAQGNFKLPN